MLELNTRSAAVLPYFSPNLQKPCPLKMSLGTLRSHTDQTLERLKEDLFDLTVKLEDQVKSRLESQFNSNATASQDVDAVNLVLSRSGHQFCLDAHQLFETAVDSIRQQLKNRGLDRLKTTVNTVTDEAAILLKVCMNQHGVEKLDEIATGTWNKAAEWLFHPHSARRNKQDQLTVSPTSTNA